MAARTARKQEPDPQILGDDQLTPEELAAAEAEQTEAGTVQEPAPAPQEVGAEPAAEPEAEAAAEAKPGKPESPAQQRIRALVEERNREREEKAKLLEDLNKQREQWARLDERRQTLQQLQTQAQQQAEAAKQAAQRPDPDIDPVGARLWDAEQRSKQLEQQFGQFQQQYQGTVQQQQQAQALLMLDNWVAQDVARFSAQKPDYVAARDHLQNVRINQYKMLGYDDNAAFQLWNTERRAYEMQAAQNGRSIAEIAYQMAQSVGYQPPQANGATAPANGGVNGKERVQQLAAAQRMQGLGGKVSQGESNDQFSNIKAMNAQQFAAFLDSMTDEQYLDLINNNPAAKTAIENKYAELG